MRGGAGLEQQSYRLDVAHQRRGRAVDAGVEQQLGDGPESFGAGGVELAPAGCAGKVKRRPAQLGSLRVARLGSR
jgi:hypothetical protein